MIQTLVKVQERMLKEEWKAELEFAYTARALYSALGYPYGLRLPTWVRQRPFLLLLQEVFATGEEDSVVRLVSERLRVSQARVRSLIVRGTEHGCLDRKRVKRGTMLQHTALGSGIHTVMSLRLTPP